MRLIQGIYFLLIIVFSASHIAAQEGIKHPDTVYVADTIVNNRVVEKVVYVYGFPSQFINAGLNGTFNYNFNTSSPYEKLSSYDIGANAFIQFHRKALIFETGLTFASNSKNLTYKYSVPYSVYDVYKHIDTISWYEEVINNIPYRKYITKETIRDTVYTRYKDSLAYYKNNFKTLQIPIIIGLQASIGFFSIEGKIGLLPGFIIHAKDGNMIVSEENTVVKELTVLNRFVCKATASISFKYMLTVNSFINIDIEYQKQITKSYTIDYWNPKPQSLGARLGISFLIKEQ